MRVQDEIEAQNSEPLSREHQLEAIIEEARARTRRRRLKIAAIVIGAACVLGAAWWGFGGGNSIPTDGEGSPAETGVPTARSESPDECPPGRGNLDYYRASNGGVRVCDLELGAEIPEGWRQVGRHVKGYPDWGNVIVPGTMNGITFADFPVGAQPLFERPRPGPGQIRLEVYNGSEGEEPSDGRFVETAMEPNDFRTKPRARVAVADGRIYRDGWAFDISVTSGLPLSAHAIEQANELLRTIRVTEHFPS